jgi:hypothetical protein
MMKYEQGTVHLDLLFLRVATDIVNMSLDQLAMDAEILYFSEIEGVYNCGPNDFVFLQM